MAEYVEVNGGINVKLFAALVAPDHVTPPPYLVYQSLDGGLTWVFHSAHRSQRRAIKETDRLFTFFVMAFVVFWNLKLGHWYYIKSQLLPPT